MGSKGRNYLGFNPTETDPDSGNKNPAKNFAGFQFHRQGNNMEAIFCWIRIAVIKDIKIAAIKAIKKNSPSGLV
jgi:hypothetical protein